MSIVRCPRCEEEVSLPTGVSEQARVRCPWCSGEYLLADARRRLPPSLVVLSDPGAGRLEANLSRHPEEVMSETALRDYSFSEPRTGFLGEPLELPLPAAESQASSFHWEEPVSRVTAPSDTVRGPDETTPDEQAPAFRFDPTSVAPSSRSAIPASASILVPRAKRKPGGPVRFLMQTVGGGAMGLVIAQAILWWMPGKWEAANRDPFQIAGRVARYAPYLVPQELHEPAPVTAVESPEAPPSLATSESTAPTGPQPPTPEDTGPSNSARSVSHKDPVLTGPLADDTQPVSVRQTGVVRTPRTGWRLSTTLRAADVNNRLLDAVHADVAWDTAANPSREDRIRLITAIYQSLARVGEVLALIGRDGIEAQDAHRAVRSKLDTLLVERMKLVGLGNLGAQGLQDSTAVGMVCYGQVVSHEMRGRFFATRVRFHSKQQPEIVLLCVDNLADQLPEGSNALILGKPVPHPQDQLEGFEGAPEAIVLYGTHVLVPTTTAAPAT